MSCPHCGAPHEVLVDGSQAAHQEYVEDCPVCCNPSRVRVRLSDDGAPHVELEPENA